jgi:hypothetical protein
VPRLGAARAILSSFSWSEKCRAGHDDLIDRMKSIHEISIEVDGTSLEEKLENFSRDANPEMEIAIWERIARAYLSFRNRDPSLTLDGKREAFRFLLCQAMGFDRGAGEHLGEDAQRELRELLVGVDE